MGRAKVNLIPLHHWAARYNTGLLNKLTPKGVVFSFLFFSFLFFSFLSIPCQCMYIHVVVLLMLTYACPIICLHALMVFVS